MGNYGFKISQTGFDVGTAADKDLVMSSSFNMLKTSAVGTASSTSVSHGLSYIPIFFTTQTVSGTQSLVGDDPQTTCDGTHINLGGLITKYYIFYQQGIT